MGFDVAPTTQKAIIPVPYNCSLYGMQGNTTCHSFGMISWSQRNHGFGIVPQYTSSIGIKTSRNWEEISWGNIAFELLMLVGQPWITGLWSNSS